MNTLIRYQRGSYERAARQLQLQEKVVSHLPILEPTDIIQRNEFNVPPRSPKEVWPTEPISPKRFDSACTCSSRPEKDNGHEAAILNASMASPKKLGRCDHCRVYTSRITPFELPSGAVLRVCSFCYRVLTQRFHDQGGIKVRADGSDASA